jgi:hypothetical protein
VVEFAALRESALRSRAPVVAPQLATDESEKREAQLVRPRLSNENLVEAAGIEPASKTAYHEKTYVRFRF